MCLTCLYLMSVFSCVVCCCMLTQNKDYLCIKNGKIIANKLNCFFINVGPSLAKKHIIDYKEPDWIYHPKYDRTLGIYPVSDNEILKLLGDLKDSGAGWDEMQPNMIKHVNEHIKLSAHICNSYFGTCVFPSDIKIANVVPSLKANDEMIFFPLPVSVLPVFSKLMEWLIYDILIYYINEKKCLFEPLTDVFDNYCYANHYIHGRETKNINALYIPCGKLNIRLSCMKLYGSNLWNTLPPYKLKIQ